MTVALRTRLYVLGLTLALGLGLLMLVPFDLGAQPARAGTIRRVCPTCEYKSIGGAVQDAVQGDTVLVEAGTYPEGKRIYPPMGVTVTSESGADHTTVIMTARDSLFDFTGVEGEPRRALTGFTIVAHPNVQTERGGAIFIDNQAKPLIAHNVFSDCVASQRGGAICIEEEGTQPVITANRFVQCAVRGDGAIGGGAIFIKDAIPIITGNVFLENHSDGHGGGLYIFGKDRPPQQALIADNWFQSNGAEGSGGAIYGLDSKPWIRGNTIISNTAYGGAGVYANECSDTRLEGNAITSNRVIRTDDFSTGGGVAVVNTARATVDSNIIRLNQAWKGDGLYIENAAGTAFTVTNNVLSDNGACELMVKNASPQIVNNTLLGTTATSSRVGMDLLGAVTKPANPRIVNNVIFGQAYGIRGSGSAAAFLSHNDLYQNSVADYSGVPVGAGDVSVDPQFVDAQGGDWHLRATSPLIDAGLSDETPSHDLDGDLRPLDGNGDGLAVVDLGADEHTAWYSTPTATASPTDAPTEAPTDTPTLSPPPSDTPTATEPSTASPTEAPTSEPTVTQTPAFTPTPTRVPRCIKQGNVWNDEFEDASLSLWQSDLATGYARFLASVMDLGVQTPQDKFPLLWTELPFPSGDYALELRIRYGNPTAYGTTIGVGSAAYDGARYQEENAPPGGIEDVLSVYQSNAELRIRLLGRISWSRPAPDTAWHVIRLSREGSAYTLGLDGRNIGSVPNSAVTAQSIYLGSPAIMHFAGQWTPIQIDYVRLQACSVWGRERLWLPIMLRSG